MTIDFNHTIVSTRDSKASAEFLAEMLGLPAPRKWGPFGEINHHDGGRGVYFEDPDGHLLEVITRPYGSGGWNP
jgi:catechol 2,3-dioxygenase-like lactoylglutathione lyase family enzyme